MLRTASIRFCIVGAACCLTLLGWNPRTAAAGEFQVASCQADQLNFSTAAFADFATRGMKIRRACNPEGPGRRGLITSNVVRAGRVPRGSVAMVTMTAPAGTRFATFRWAGSAQRRDCRYALQLYADAPDAKPIPIKNVRPNQHCPSRARAQAAGYRARTFDISGATRIVQRVICVGSSDRKSCSARGSNFIRTYKAQVAVLDAAPPAVGILGDTPLARGAWVAGTQPLDYSATDNVGVRNAQALMSGLTGGFQQRPCVLASLSGAFADATPCVSGPGWIIVDTHRFPEGTHQLVVQGQDAAGNVGTSRPVLARIDNTAPARVDVSVAGGEQWRTQNSFVAGWTNPPEPDRAPITAVNYKLCAGNSNSCATGTRVGVGISHIAVQVPAPGQWTLSLWRQDAAGNTSAQTASVPVVLRYDPEAPRVAFEPSPASDPTLVSALVTDRVSGLASGSIEISRVGSNIWQILPTRTVGSRLLARIDDAALPAGSYVLRATAYDQAQNEGSTTSRLDGQPMAITLPLRIASTMRAGVQHIKTVRRTVHRHHRRRHVRQRVRVLLPSARVAFGHRVQVRGQLANRDGQGIGGAEIRVLSSVASGQEQLVAVLHTDADGRYRYTATGSESRTLRFSYAGSPLILPAQSTVRLLVPAVSTLHVSRRHVLNGQAVTFGGRVRTLPVPVSGKLIQLEVRLSGRWQTFRTVRTAPAGQWSIRYRFKRTRGVQRYRFRVALPPEAGYSYEAGSSRSLVVRVRGRG